MVEIELIPAEKRTLGPIAFFFIWAGAGISLAEVLAGGFLAPVGLIAGIMANVLGHLVGNTLFSMGGVIGTDYGIPSMVSVRPSFGVRGSYLATVFNALQLVGWTAVMLVVAARSLDSISKEMLDFSNYPVWVVIMGIAVTAWAWVGREGWKWLQSVVSALLLVICGYIGYIILSTVGLRGLLTVPRTGTMGFGLACDLVIAMPLSWLPLVADYSRFGRSTRGAFCGTWAGYFVSSSLMYTLGLAAVLATGEPDIIATLTALGMGAAALFVVAFSTLTTAFLDVYSTAVSIQNLLPKLRERHLILVAGALGTLVALSFPIERYENFLLFIGGVFVPLFGIVLADYFLLRRRKLATQDLFKRGGAYWYTSGVNPAAIVAWIIGALIYYVCTRTGFWLGASIPSFTAASGLYLAEMALAAAHESRRTKGVDAR